MNKTVLALDTNIWIYLCKAEFEPILKALINEVDKGNLEIIVNDVILIEWERNKENTINRLVENIKQEYLSAKKLELYIEDEKTLSKYKEILNNYKSEKKRIEYAKKKVENIEKFMKRCTQVLVTDSQKLYVANLAINKRFPFSNNKNNFNDTVILRNLLETISSIILRKGSCLPFRYDLIYVSNNPKDFLDPETNNIHKNIIDGLEDVRIISLKDLSQALHVKDVLIDDFDDWLEYMINMHAELEAEIKRGK